MKIAPGVPQHSIDVAEHSIDDVYYLDLIYECIYLTNGAIKVSLGVCTFDVLYISSKN